MLKRLATGPADFHQLDLPICDIRGEQDNFTLKEKQTICAIIFFMSLRGRSPEAISIGTAEPYR